MDEKLAAALAILDDIVEGQKTIIADGLLPRVMEDGTIKTMNALVLVLNYVRDNEDLKKI